MVSTDKICLLEEIIGVDTGSLNEEMLLSDIKAWDSLARITFMSMVDEKYGRVIDGSDLKDCKAVKDLLRIME